MRTFAIIAILALAATAVSAAPSNPEEFEAYLFQRYVETHGKVYAAHEVDMRFQIFRTNLAAVRQHNEQFAAGEVSFKMGMNRFADMTNAEYRSKMLSFRNLEFPQTMKPTRFVPSNDAPADSVDWRTHTPAVVSPIKDQGQCGSCWSFSAVGSMEGAHALSTGTLVTFSEEQLVNCVNGGADTCDQGGLMDDAFTYAIQYGMESEQEYPYTATSPPNSCKYSKSKVLGTFSKFSDVESGSEAALAAAVAAQPTVSVAIDASHFSFQMYTSGIYNERACSSTQLDHGVLAVGYGSQGSSNYWIVKNSWGTSWGQSGYIFMTKDKKNQCGIATMASFITV